MRIEDEALGDLMRDVVSGWPSDEFLRELRSRRQTRPAIWFGLAATMLALVAIAISWSITSTRGHSIHPHGPVQVSEHQCDAGEDLAAAFRSAIEAEALGDTACAVRNFSRVVLLAEPEHGRCSVGDHPVDAQVAIARWELSHLTRSEKLDR